ncbi:hypothetical protein BC830DRAFT_1083849 [Chytriomyces sp. MP71]|nr:hypothetical protein BC830DRAFT_1083849 [Chytriomyces sp. MP71]
MTGRSMGDSEGTMQSPEAGAAGVDGGGTAERSGAGVALSFLADAALLGSREEGGLEGSGGRGSSGQRATSHGQTLGATGSGSADRSLAFAAEGMRLSSHLPRLHRRAASSDAVALYSQTNSNSSNSSSVGVRIPSPPASDLGPVRFAQIGVQQQNLETFHVHRLAANHNYHHIPQHQNQSQNYGYHYNHNQIYPHPPATHNLNQHGQFNSYQHQQSHEDSEDGSSDLGSAVGSNVGSAVGSNVGSNVGSMVGSTLSSTVSSSMRSSRPTVEQRFLTPPTSGGVRANKAQLKVLQEIYDQNPTPTGLMHQAIAERIGMTRASVRNWFQNNRAKMRRIAQENAFRGEMAASSQQVSNQSALVPQQRVQPDHQQHHQQQYETQQHHQYQYRPQQAQASHTLPYSLQQPPPHLHQESILAPIQPSQQYQSYPSHYQPPHVSSLPLPSLGHLSTPSQRPQGQGLSNPVLAAPSKPIMEGTDERPRNVMSLDALV